jgi:environmental stress-induced protein Ves
MPEVIWIPSEGARPSPRRGGRGEVEELACWPEEARLERGNLAWRMARGGSGGPLPLDGAPGYDRILLVTGGSGATLESGDDGPRLRLRPLEPCSLPGEGATTMLPAGGPAEAFEVLVRRGSFRAEVEVLRLGARQARDAIGPGQAFVHMLRGAAQARVTGEEEPFELDPGDSLWARDLRGGEELDLVGEEQGTVVLLVRLTPATS